MLNVIALVVPGEPFDQLPSTLIPPTLRLLRVFVPIIGTILTLSIVNRAVFEGVKARTAVEVITNLSVYVPFAETAVPVKLPTEGVIVPAVWFDIV